MSEAAVALREKTAVLPVITEAGEEAGRRVAEDQDTAPTSELNFNQSALALAEAEAAEYTAVLYAEQKELLDRLAEVRSEIGRAHDREQHLEVVRQARALHSNGGNPQRAINGAAPIGTALERLPSVGQEMVPVNGNSSNLAKFQAATRVGSLAAAEGKPIHVGSREENVTNATEVADEIARLFRESASCEREAERSARDARELEKSANYEGATLERNRQDVHLSRAATLREMARTIRKRGSFPRAIPLKGDAQLLEDTLTGLKRL